MRFSVIVVSYNSGERLKNTLKCIFDQDFDDYEIVVKDGLSTDGSAEGIEKIAEECGKADKLKVYRTADKGIYDAMNEAVSYASGDYFVFMNCGDEFYDRTVLGKVSEAIDSYKAPLKKDGSRKAVIYGNRYLIPTKSTEYFAPQIAPLVCYRNIPCHQCCFYSASCFDGLKYRTNLKVRADYEHFLRLYFEEKAEFYHIDECVARYEGGGYSENPESVKRSAAEHRAITKKYMSKWQLFYCRAYMIITLQPLRRAIASNKKLAGAYNGLVKKIYRKKN
ncbi:MAG: glycosyltransferase [Lachnospiraceae bacterium]|nr:glycosyltransferase [Lachnospiraceae bacterium]